MATIDLTKPRQVNFATIEKDYEKILERFFNNQNLLKLLYYNTPDCLTRKDLINNEDLATITQHHIKIVPRMEIKEQEGSMIFIQFDHFVPNFSNPQFIDNDILIDVLCPNKENIMILNNYMLRPHMIMHEINSMLDNKKLNGIGTVHFNSAIAINLDSHYGYRLSYSVINNI